MDSEVKDARRISALRAHRRLGSRSAASGAHLRALVENVSDLVVLVDRNGVIQFVSPSIERMGGYQPEDVMGRNLLEFIHPEDAFPALLNLKAIARNEEEPVTSDRRFRHRDGHWVVLEIVAKSALDDPVIRGIVVSARDVTERRRGERELQFKNSVLSTQQETSVDGILIVDGEGRILSCNGKFIEMFRVPAELIHAGDDRAVLRFALELVEDPKAFLARIEYLYDHRVEKSRDEVRLNDGRIIERDSAPVVAADGTYYGRVWYFRDTTLQRSAERRLARVDRARRALSSAGSLLMHASNEMELVQAMCDGIVAIGGYRLAWVGLVEHDESKSIRPVGHAGYEQGYIERVHVTWADEESGRGPIGLAVRSGMPQVVHDTQADLRFAPWRAAAAKEQGYGSVVALPLAAPGGPIGVLTIYASEVNAFDEAEIELLKELADNLGFGLLTLRTREAHQQSTARLLKSMEGTVLAMAATMESRDAYTAGHQRRVGELAVAIAREMQLSKDEIDGIHLAAIVHDLGKIRVPAEILSKPGRLSEIEYELIKVHPQVGYDILKTVDFPWPIAEIVYQHHERMNGSGYPRGLAGDAILIGARILAVADTVEAMSAHRPYREGLGIDSALDEITINRGKTYDAAPVDACVRLFREKAFAFPY